MDGFQNKSMDSPSTGLGIDKLALEKIEEEDFDGDDELDEA